MKRILGISAFYHDSAAALTAGGKIVAAAQEERFTRKKHTPDFPVNAIKFCLEETRLNIDGLDAVVFYDKPFLKFERLLETDSPYMLLTAGIKEEKGSRLPDKLYYRRSDLPSITHPPEDAYRCFMSTEMDYLVMEDFVYCKTEQNDWQNREKWKAKVNAD
ncbi:MAG: carbamoyltransferase N-terminal domain-containing protein [Smithella sp.]